LIDLSDSFPTLTPGSANEKNAVASQLDAQFVKHHGSRTFKHFILLDKRHWHVALPNDIG
jgi:hypothetical protein